MRLSQGLKKLTRPFSRILVLKSVHSGFVGSLEAHVSYNYPFPDRGVGHIVHCVARCTDCEPCGLKLYPFQAAEGSQLRGQEVVSWKQLFSDDNDV